MIIWGLKSQPVIDRKKQNEQHEKSYINSGQIKLRNYQNAEEKKKS